MTTQAHARRIPGLGAMALAAAAVAGGLVCRMPAAGAPPAQARPADKDAKDAKAKPMSEAEAAVRAAGDAYVKALTSGDLDAILGFWTADADYIPVGGSPVRGQAALRARFKESAAENKGLKLRLVTDTVRMLGDNAAVQDGAVVEDTPEGEQKGRFSSVWSKQDGKWRIARITDLPEAGGPGPAAAALSHLDWMVGEWTGQGDGRSVTLSIDWDMNRQFLVQDFELKGADGKVLEVEQRIGWDPTLGRLRSWIFDSHGGFAEGLWERDGNEWTVTINGVVASGQPAGQMNVWRYEDENNFVWKSFRRQLDGTPLPDVGVKFHKNPESKPEPKPGPKPEPKPEPKPKSEAKPEARPAER